MVLNRTKAVSFALLLVFGVANMASCTQTAPSVIQGTTQEASASPTKWFYSYDEALKAAQKDNKPILMDVYTDWCGWCKKMDQSTFGHKTFQAEASKFVLAKVDGDKNKELVQKYGVRGYPTVVFLDSKGNLLQQSVGFKEASDFVVVMKEVLQKSKPKE